MRFVAKPPCYGGFGTGGRQGPGRSKPNGAACAVGPNAVSSPTAATIKEASFVYQGKRGFFLLFEKNRAKYRHFGLSGGGSAVRKPDFFISGSENGRKCWCTFCVSLLCKELQKNTGWVDLNLEKPVIKPFFESRQKRKHS